jgi:Ca2+-binding RTX toxin-like protein
MKRAVLIAALGLALGLPASAAASVSCEYDAPTESLTVTTTGGSINMDTSNGEILVQEWGSHVDSCQEIATLSDTSEIEIVDSYSDSSVFGSIFEIRGLAQFAPGIPITLTLPDSDRDVLELIGGPENDHWTFGDAGIDTDGEGGPDITYSAAPPASIVATGEGGSNVLSARGGSGTGPPVSTSHVGLLSVGKSVDTLEGTEGNDEFSIGSGPDVVRGFGGDDYIVQNGKGDDLIEGGAGEDLLGFFQSSQGVTVDLSRTTQDTGEGVDTILGIEDVSGSEGDDSLIGDEGPNRLYGWMGDDALEGGGGDDTLEGGTGRDTVTYADAPAGVEANLLFERATGGAGIDTLIGMENLIGSPFADFLIGDGQNNTIIGRGGSDVVRALDGNDLVKVRDGMSDEVTCGPGVDGAVADSRSVDAIYKDCEQVDAFPEIPRLGPPPVAHLGLRLGGALDQPLLKQRTVVVQVRCLEKACDAVATGRAQSPKLRLRPAVARLAADTPARLHLRLGRRQLAAIRSLLAAGKHPKLTIIVTAAASGEVVRRTMVVTARR